MRIQTDFKIIVSWCISITISIFKMSKYDIYEILLFYSLRFNINNFGLSLVYDYIRYLGFILCSTLNPHLYIDTVCCKALKMLRFLKRVTSDFKLTNSLSALHRALIHSTLEYSSVVWDPLTIKIDVN